MSYLKVRHGIGGLPALLRHITVPVRWVRGPKLQNRRDRLLHPRHTGLRSRGCPLQSQARTGQSGLHGHCFWLAQSSPGLCGLHHIRGAGQQEWLPSTRGHHLLPCRLRLLLHRDSPGCPDDGLWPDQSRVLHVLWPLRGGVHPAGSATLPECVSGVAGFLLWCKIWISVEAIVLPTRKVSMGQQSGGGRLLLRQLWTLRSRSHVLPADQFFPSSQNH